MPVQIRDFLPHKSDLYRVEVVTFDTTDKTKLYILDISEMSALSGLNLPTAQLTGDLHQFLDQAIVPLLLVTFNSKNHSDVDNLKWDAVQSAYKLGYNPLVSRT
jgi:hypothetical protein